MPDGWAVVREVRRVGRRGSKSFILVSGGGVEREVT